MPIDKTLWIVSYPDAHWLLAHAQQSGAATVAIRTDNNVANALPLFHQNNIKVFGWRWPSSNLQRALHEAQAAVHLLGLGMDGYIVDPEGEPGADYDWDKDGLEDVAAQFCSTIRNAHPDKPFGVTSHYRARDIFPRLPWSVFIGAATVCLPQSYWRVAGGPVHHANPTENYNDGIQAWQEVGASPGIIVPMGGEIAYSSAAEIGQYAGAASAHGIRSLNFYTATPGVHAEVWAAIAAL